MILLDSDFPHICDLPASPSVCQMVTCGLSILFTFLKLVTVLLLISFSFLFYSSFFSHFFLHILYSIMLLLFVPLLVANAMFYYELVFPIISIMPITVTLEKMTLVLLLLRFVFSILTSAED